MLIALTLLLCGCPRPGVPLVEVEEDPVEQRLRACEPEAVGREGDVLVVRPHAWTESGSWTWFDAKDLEQWILSGTPGDRDDLDFRAVLEARTFPIAVDGQPRMEPTPARVPYFFSQAYVAPLALDPEQPCEADADCPEEGPCRLGVCAQACAETVDCRQEGQRGTFGGYVCDDGACMTPPLSMATRVVGFADRFDGDARPGGAGDLDPTEFARTLGLSEEHPVHESADCSTAMDCPDRISGRTGWACTDRQCVGESDREVFDGLLPRWRRRQEVIAAQRSLTEVHFGHDSDNLQCALDAVGNRPLTLLLDGERFVLNQPVVARDFHGRLQGRGMDETVVTTLGGGHVPASPPFDAFPAFLVFGGGEVAVASFTFEVAGTTDWGSHHMLQDGIIALYLTGTPTHRDAPAERLPLDVTLEDLRFQGSGGSYVMGTNLLASAVVGEWVAERDRFGGNLFHYAKPTTGDHVVRGCEALGSFNGVAAFASVQKGTILLEGNQGDGPGPLLALQDVSGTDVVVRGNRTEGAGLLYLREGSAVSGTDLGPHPMSDAGPSDYLITGNTARAAVRSWAAVEMRSDRAALGLAPSQVSITDNHLESRDNTGDPFPYEGVFSQGLDGVTVLGNTLAGRGRAAISVGLEEPFADTGWTIADNTFLFTASEAQVHLGAATHGNTVCGTTSVRDDSGRNAVAPHCP